MKSGQRLLRTLTAGIIGVFLAAVIFEMAGAIPRFSAEQGLACNQCHFSFGGGAMRTEFGHYTMSVNELTLQVTKRKLMKSYKGPRLSPAVLVGADVRMRLLEDGTVNRHQTDYYASFEPFSAAYFNFTLSSGTIDESYLLVTNEQRSVFVQVGRFYPQFGLRLEDFTAFVKTKTGVFHRAALEGANAGVTSLGHTLSLAYYSVGQQSVYIANLNRFGFFSDISYFYGASARFSEELNDGTHGGQFAVKGVYGGIGYRTFSLVYEGDLIGEANESYATYIGAAVRVIPGVYAKADYNFYDPDRNSESGVEEFTRVSAEVWPMPFVEVNPGVAFHTRGPLDGERVYELRLHLSY